MVDFAFLSDLKLVQIRIYIRIVVAIFDALQNFLIRFLCAYSSIFSCSCRRPRG